MGKAILEILVFSVGYIIGGILGIKIIELCESIEDKLEKRRRERRRYGKSKEIF